MNKLTIQYLSDIHLEFYGSLTKVSRLVNWIQPKSNICVLAGDIGYPFQKQYEIFLKSMNHKFEHTFLIPGNHEFYQMGKNKNKTMNDVIQQIENIIQSNELNNIHFLNNSHYDLRLTDGNEYRFIGSTLWTHISDNNYLINDFDKINEMTINKMNSMHKESKDYIKSMIQQCEEDNKKIIMITHHLPSFSLNHPKYIQYKNYNQCFSSHSDDLIKDPVKCWIFGHTHAEMTMNINNIPCVVNPIGYPGENAKIDFNKVIDIPF